MLSTSLIGLGFGLMIGAIVAAVSGSSTAAPILIGGAIGMGLGFGIALATPSYEGRAQNDLKQDSDGIMAESPSAPHLPASVPGGGI